MIRPVRLPRGVSNILMLGDAEIDTVREGFQHRPDLLNNSFRNEVINNWVSVTSPIDCKKGTTYIVTGVKFMSFFGAS